MNNIGIYDPATDTYREVTVKDGEVVIPLKPAFRYDADGGAWVAEIEDPTRIGLMDAGGEYREIDYGEAEQIVPLRPGPWDTWDGSAWVAGSAPRDIAAEISGHALALKIGVVNATRTDGLTDPVTPEALATIKERYTEIVNEASAKAVMGETVTDAEKQVVALIRQGFAFFKAVDAAAETILAAGDAADPIAGDTRWPPLPGA